jgi:hypothetical protein
MASLAMCCPHAKPGDLCPMHRSKQADEKCQMRAACAPSDSALVALADGVGDFQDFSISVGALQSLEPTPTIAPSPFSRADRPDAPPPKA